MMRADVSDFARIGDDREVPARREVPSVTEGGGGGARGTRVSVITPVLNGQGTIEDTIRSVAGQRYPDIEYLVVDNGSTDATLDIVGRYRHAVSAVIGEGRKGIYPAMNRGIQSAHGEIIGILNADDCYADEGVIEKVTGALLARNADVCWGDLVYVDRIHPEKVLRYWRSSEYRKGIFEKGWMPPHPTFFVKKWVYDRYGVFDLAYRFAADYELMLRFLHTCGVRGAYIPELLVRMRIGGMTNRGIGNIIRKSREDYRALRLHDVRGRLCALAMKNISKLPQFFRRPPEARRGEAAAS